MNIPKIGQNIKNVSNRVVNSQIGRMTKLATAREDAELAKQLRIMYGRPAIQDKIGMKISNSCANIANKVADVLKKTMQKTIEKR